MIPGVNSIRLHEPGHGDRSWRERFRYSVFIPAVHAVCLIEVVNRPNVGVSSLGVWVWDDTEKLPPLFPYSYFADSLPALPADLDDVVIDDKLRLNRLANGNTRLRFDDSPRLSFDIAFEGIAPGPIEHPHPDRVSIEGPLRATGFIALPDWDIEVDDVAIVSHTWGGVRSSLATAFGCSGIAEGLSFNVRSDRYSDGSESVEGFIYLDGKVSELATLQRHISQYLDGYPFEIQLTMTDELDRTVMASGAVANTAELHTDPSLEVVTSLTNWTVGNRELWGGDWEFGPRTQRMNQSDESLGLSRPASLSLGGQSHTAAFRATAAGLLALTREFCQAIEAGDFERMQRLWEQSRRVVCVHPGLPILKGWQAVATSWVERLVEPVEIVPANLSVTIDGNLAWVAYDCDTVSNTIYYNTPTILVATTTYAYNNGRWLVIAHHGSVVAQRGR